VPSIYLSPSTQEYNTYVTGSGSEEYHMNLLADALIPYLLSNGIRYARNTPDMTAASSIRQANEARTTTFYLALHSNASGEGHYGENRGIIAFYYPGSAEGRRAAELFAQQLREVYPLPNRVRIQSTTALGEVRQPHFPAVLLEIGYHDNYADAAWLESHMDAAAQSIWPGD
jgi:N-acetylmuramoyl-L-alanine amidase